MKPKRGETMEQYVKRLAEELIASQGSLDASVDIAWWLYSKIMAMKIAAKEKEVA